MGRFSTDEKYTRGVLYQSLVNKSIGNTPLTKHNMDKEAGNLKLEEENRKLKEELEVLRKAFAI